MHRTTPPIALALLFAACSSPAGSPTGTIPDASPGPTRPGPDAGAAWTLLWSDEFNGPDGSGPDPRKWVFDTGGGGWGNGEMENYTSRPDNAVLRQGRLVITARQESYQGSPYTSARLKTAGKFAFTYGRVEMRASLPQGQGLWPAFWMLGANIDKGTAWPGCGEIDIMEFVGKTPTRIYGTLHGPGYSGGNGIGAWHADTGGFSGAFHEYAVEWEPGGIRWYFDGKLYEQRTLQDLAGKTWVYDHDFFLLLNLAIGGAFPGPPDNTTRFPQDYLIDYVRVYQRTGAVPPPARRIVGLKARLNGKFVSADRYNADLLSATRATASTWEFYEQKDLGGGQTALWALSEDKYVSGGSDGGAPLAATSEGIGPAETFSLTSNADGSLSLRCARNGKYVTVPGNGPLQAIAAAVTPAEEFDLVPQ